jgi:hypothetical protein
MLLVNCYQRMGANNKARELLEDVIERFPREGEPVGLLVEIAVTLGDFGHCGEIIRQA